MREILFKAKRLSDGAWVEGFPYWGEYSGAFILQNKTYSRRNARTGEISMGDNIVPIEVDPSTVCEYTGLTDRDGTKVFEGDRLFDPHEKRTFVVEYDPLEAGFTLESNDGRYVNFNRVPYSKIIGNIYDGEGGRREEVAGGADEVQEVFGDGQR